MITRTQITGMLIGLMGFGVALLADWQMALGIFLMLWGNNMERSGRGL